MSKHVLFEVGLEELPARFIHSAEKQLYDKTIDWLKDHRLTFKDVTSFSTPRRLAVLIDGIADEQTSLIKEVRGPSEAIAKDNNGDWSKAALGFVKGQNQTVDDIYIENINDTPYIFVKNHIEGKPVDILLPDFKSVLASMNFPQTMRWGSKTFKYARPIRWVVGMYNDKIIPFELASIKSSNKTYGHRFLGELILLDNAEEYEQKLSDNFVIAHPMKRKQMILDGFHKLNKNEPWEIVVHSDLLEEVCNLVEYPTVFFGTFDKKFLSLPEEVLITSMQEHQRYFPVRNVNGQIDRYFVGVRNGDDYELSNVVKGNEKVLRARLSDAEFFFEEDKKQSIAINLQKLDRVIYQEQLGSFTNKINRVVKLTTSLTKSFSMETAETAIRTAEICKFDLMTHMVNEFTELQGVMGEKYAQHFGETKSVATAIREHYLPTKSGGNLPTTEAGAIVSISDKLDSVVSFILIGLKPTGSQDPYSLRRQATGVLRILIDRKWDISFDQLLNMALSSYGKNDIKESDLQEIQSFFKQRASYLMQENDIEQDVIRAVLESGIGYMSYTIDKAVILSEKRYDPSFKFTEEALVRLVNLANNSQVEFDSNLLQTESERTLFKEYLESKKTYDTAKHSKNAVASLDTIANLAQPIHNFFEHNMVMAEDENVKNNRLALVNTITSLIHDFADLTKIEWKQQS